MLRGARKAAIWVSNGAWWQQAGVARSSSSAHSAREPAGSRSATGLRGQPTLWGSIARSQRLGRRDLEAPSTGIIGA
jgi:hypothetical protein